MPSDFRLKSNRVVTNIGAGPGFKPGEIEIPPLRLTSFDGIQILTDSSF